MKKNETTTMKIHCETEQTRQILRRKGVLVIILSASSSVTRTRQFGGVSRIRYVSDTDTCSIRLGYVSSRYPNFYYFREYWIRGPIRIERAVGRQAARGAAAQRAQLGVSGVRRAGRRGGASGSSWLLTWREVSGLRMVQVKGRRGWRSKNMGSHQSL